MDLVYFHCSTPDKVLADRCGSPVRNLTEAHQHAGIVVGKLLMTPGPQDWRGWILHVSDRDGEEIFNLPFAALIGKPH